MSSPLEPKLLPCYSREEIENELFDRALAESNEGIRKQVDSDRHSRHQRRIELQKAKSKNRKKRKNR